MLHVIKYDFPDIVEYFWVYPKPISKICIRPNVCFGLTFHAIPNTDTSTVHLTVYGLVNWKKSYWPVKKEKLVMSDLRAEIFVESLTALLYNARLAECMPSMLYNSAYFMLRGIMTESGLKRFDRILYV